MAHGGSDAVGAGVASSDDDDVFSGGGYEFAFIPIGLELTFFCQEESFLILSEEFLEMKHTYPYTV
jgi:hypothetical protein